MTFTVTGDGTLDSTGLLGDLARLLSEGVTLTIAGSTEGGAESRLTLTIAPAITVETAPAALVPPSLPPVVRIGENVALDPGLWSGTPAPALAVAWLVDGAVVPGASGTSFAPRPEDDGKALSAKVTASNAAGQAEAVAEARTVTRRPPVARGALADLRLVPGAAPAVVETAAAFEGEALRFAASAAEATVIPAIDPATGRLTLGSDAFVGETTVTVTATNSGGTAEVAFRLSMEEKPGEEPPAGQPPVAVGTLADAAFEQGAAAVSISAAAGFAGPDLVFALQAAPEGAAIDAGSGLVRIPTDRPLDAAPVTVRASNAAGQASQAFRVSVRANTTVFGTAPRLAELGFVNQAGAPASWTIQPGGFARLLTDPAERNHGDWTLARGDGLYRCLVRWNHPSPALDWHRPFSFVGRLKKQGTAFSGVRAEFAQHPGAKRMLELREYTGSGVQATELATLDVGWQWDTWYWVEVELDGAAVRARLYREAEAAPAWQLAAQTTELAPGGFGPGAFGRQGSVALDIRRLEYRPLARSLEAAPPRPVDADWSIDQIKVQA